MSASLYLLRIFAGPGVSLLAFFLVISSGPSALLLAEEPSPTNRPARLSMEAPASNGWPRIAGDYFDATAEPQVFNLQFSTDLHDWRTAAVLLQAPFQFTDPRPGSFSAGFYRLMTDLRTSTNDWANQLQFPDDLLFNPGECGSDRLRWAKFAIDLNEPHRVYFQDSSRYLLHVEFATNRLAGFHGLTAEQFNALALHAGTQRIVLGTILAPLGGLGAPAGNEFAIQFSGFDPYPPDRVVEWIEIVKSAVASKASRAFYLPTFEQAPSAEQHRAYFAARGIEILSLERWNSDTPVCYAPGWAVGRLQFVTASEIDTAYADGRLLPSDILLTDGVPAEVPYVSGILSLVPATPNSHVAILAQSYGVPFAYVADPAERTRLLDLGGRTVAFRTGLWLADCRCQVIDVEGMLPPNVTNHISGLKAPARIEIPPKSHLGKFSAVTEGLLPSDIRVFGGKAANFGLLRRVLPNHSPDAIAFSFDLWDEFLDQPFSGGVTLREAIRGRLGGFTYPPDVALLRSRLAEVRHWIRNVAGFTSAQSDAILEALGRFENTRNIRFRSSTNVEDAERFSGAGLYDSYSGCLADDLDMDGSGPSVCDPTEADERGVYRAIQRVYASFYNENAFLERLRFGLDEDVVGMGLLVHYSTPDPSELANGVATVAVGPTGNSVFVNGQLVTQVGAVSVANPDGTARPEMASFSWTPNYTNVQPGTSSSLVPMGTRVLGPDDYPMLAGLLGRAAQEYSRLFPNRSRIELDFEYKKESPGRLSVKQIREVPSSVGTNPLPAFALTSPAREFHPWGDVWAVHRLKSVWSLATRSTLFTLADLQSNVYSTVRVELLDRETPRTLEGDLTSWPGALHQVLLGNNQWQLTDRFLLGAGSNRYEATLTITGPRFVSPGESPWLTLAEAQLQYTVKHPTPVPVFTTEPSLTSLETVSLLPDATAGFARTESNLIVTNHSVRLYATFREVQLIGALAESYEPDPRCFLIGPKNTFGYLGLEGETRLEGLLAEPLILRSRYAQTFLHRGRRGHETVHELICDPWLEPSLTAAQRAALTAANVRALYYYHYRFGDETERFVVLGLDGQFRQNP